MDDQPEQGSSIIKTDQDEMVLKVPSQAEERFSISRSILRLVVGGAIQSISTVTEEMRRWESAHPESQPVIEPIGGEPDTHAAAQMREAGIGLMFRSLETAQKGASLALYSADMLSRRMLRPFKPLANSRLLGPLNRQFDALAARGQEELASMVRSGQLDEQRGREMAQDVFNKVVGEVVQNLSNNPQITVLIRTQLEVLANEPPESPQLDELVRTLAGNYINYLEQNPEQVQKLIRSQGNEYIGYLNENPSSVQTLIAGQSLSLTSQIRDEIRSLLVTLDSVLEDIARSVFRRTSREDLPEPPPEVQAHAIQKLLEMDFSQTKAKQDDQN